MSVLFNSPIGNCCLTFLLKSFCTPRPLPSPRADAYQAAVRRHQGKQTEEHSADQRASPQLPHLLPGVAQSIALNVSMMTTKTAHSCASVTRLIVTRSS